MYMAPCSVSPNFNMPSEHESACNCPSRIPKYCPPAELEQPAAQHSAAGTFSPPESPHSAISPSRALVKDVLESILTAVAVQEVPQAKEGDAVKLGSRSPSTASRGRSAAQRVAVTAREEGIDATASDNPCSIPALEAVVKNHAVRLEDCSPRLDLGFKDGTNHSCDTEFALESMEVEGPADSWLRASTDLSVLSGCNSPAAAVQLQPHGPSWDEYVTSMDEHVQVAAEATPQQQQHPVRGSSNSCAGTDRAHSAAAAALATRLAGPSALPHPPAAASPAVAKCTAEKPQACTGSYAAHLRSSRCYAQEQQQQQHQGHQKKQQAAQPRSRSTSPAGTSRQKQKQQHGPRARAAASPSPTSFCRVNSTPLPADALPETDGPAGAAAAGMAHAGLDVVLGSCRSSSAGSSSVNNSRQLGSTGSQLDGASAAWMASLRSRSSSGTSGARLSHCQSSGGAAAISADRPSLATRSKSARALSAGTAAGGCAGAGTSASTPDRPLQRSSSSKGKATTPGSASNSHSSSKRLAATPGPKPAVSALTRSCSSGSNGGGNKHTQLSLRRVNSPSAGRPAASPSTAPARGSASAATRRASITSPLATAPVDSTLMACAEHAATAAGLPVQVEAFSSSCVASPAAHAADSAAAAGAAAAAADADDKAEGDLLLSEQEMMADPVAVQLFMELNEEIEEAVSKASESFSTKTEGSAPTQSAEARPTAATAAVRQTEEQQQQQQPETISSQDSSTKQQEQQQPAGEQPPEAETGSSEVHRHHQAEAAAAAVLEGLQPPSAEAVKKASADVVLGLGTKLKEVQQDATQEDGVEAVVQVTPPSRAAGKAPEAAAASTAVAVSATTDESSAATEKGLRAAGVVGQAAITARGSLATETTDPPGCSCRCVIM